MHDRLLSRDSTALGEIYDLHACAVFGLAVHVTRSRHAAEDVVQEAFLQLWEHPERFDPSKGTLRGWLCTLAHRRAVDFVRRSQAEKRRSERYAMAAAAVDLTDDESSSLQQALAHLPAEQAMAIRLAYFGGRTYREVARVLGIPEGTAKTRIRMGLQQLHALTRAADNDQLVTP